jgi:hypothetical protein
MSSPSLEPLRLIFREREKQVYEKNHTPEKDEKYRQKELLRAALCYAAERQLNIRLGEAPVAGSIWPWGYRHWSPSDDRLENLATAGALLLAEMEREIRHRERLKTDPHYEANLLDEAAANDEDDE